ncbi:MAG: pilin, partial [Pseudomonadota bacterium]
MKTGKKIVVLLAITFIFLPVFVRAAPSWWPIVPCGLNSQPKDSSGVELPKVPTQENPDAHDYTQSCTRCDLFKLFKNIIDFVLVGLMPPIAAILFVWGGFLILASAGNTEWVAQGKTIFWNTFMGVVIISASWLITNTIIKSLAEESITNPDVPWYQFECKTTAYQSSAQKYLCNSDNQCVADASGTYTEATCNNECQAESAPVPSITTPSLSDAVQNQTYSQTLAA